MNPYVYHSLQELLRKVDAMSQQVDALVAAVASQRTVVTSVKTLLAQLFALVQAGIDTGDLAKAQAALDDLKAQDAELAQAVVDNTPKP